MKYESGKFWLPELSELASVLQSGLELNYRDVSVAVVECPDLTGIGVASAGMCGSTALFEFGGEPYAHNPKYRGANVNIAEMIAASDISQAKAFGAAMGDMAVMDGNSGELIPNVDPASVNKSRVARVGGDQECVVESYESLDCGPIVNLFVSEGLREKVLRVEVKTRIGEQASLTQAIRDGLSGLAEDNGHIGMGGVFEVLSGHVKSHVMPNYACLVPGYYDVESEQVVKDFLQFYDHMGPGLLAFCTLWTGDPTDGELNLRVSGEHTHFYHHDDGAQQAGHYHGDNTPDEIHCVGYFSLAEKIYRFGDIYSEMGIKP